MRLLLISLFLIVRTCSSLRPVDRFEFGQDIGSIVFSTSGSISVLEKLKRVSVVVPLCTDLKYVRVDVNNMFGPPQVVFDWDTRSVVIEYSPLQLSVSHYTISAKGVKKEHCNENNVLPPLHGIDYFDIFPQDTEAIVMKPN